MLGANYLLNETSLPSVPSDIPSDSSLGPDRIPYSGWKAAGEAATITLHSYGLHLINGSMLLANFNDSTLVFAPEGDNPNDAKEIIRDEFDVQPLSLKKIGQQHRHGSLC